MNIKAKSILVFFLLFLMASETIEPAFAQQNLPVSWVTWEKIENSNIPAPRYGFAMTNNPTNQVTLMFGGRSAEKNVTLNDLWVTNGREWIQFSTPHAPDGRLYASMAYDEGRQEAVLFGGSNPSDMSYYNDTWAFNGVDWIKKNPTDNPSPRSSAALVYDPERQRTYLFGGADYGKDGLTQKYNDTWVWDGSNWQQLFPDTKPGARDRTSLVYDPVRHNFLLYGGDNYAAPYTDTWVWNGEAWIEQHPLHQPSMFFSETKMAFDETRQQIILVGIVFAYPKDRTETWAWDGQDWTPLSVVNPLDYGFLYSGKLMYFPELKTVALVGLNSQKIINPDNTISFIDRSEVWALSNRQVNFLPYISQ